ncbi:WG repeat-containing protein [Coleofasciculus sp. H7-2]|uniref:WG repeat-containing protein n=1 Tax=Coleofasciculus sp. H7-2 TaxID=3351545 RepID=UPI00366ECA26
MSHWQDADKYNCSTLVPQNDKTGDRVIKPQFEAAENFSEGLAVVTINKAGTRKNWQSVGLYPPIKSAKIAVPKNKLCIMRSHSSDSQSAFASRCQKPDR